MSAFAFARRSLAAWHTTVGAATLAALLAPALLDRAHAAPDASTPLTARYEIRMEGSPIGQEVVQIQRDGDKTEVSVKTQTDVHILFLSFHYDHQRSEQWQGGRLLRMTAKTNDDGTITTTTAEALPQAGWRFTVNDVPSERAEDSLPLTLWTSAVTRPSHLFSVIDAAPYAVQVSSLGVEPLALGSETVEAQHYHITGDVDRDLWFDPQGMLIKTTFIRRGYPIEMVRLAN